MTILLLIIIFIIIIFCLLTFIFVLNYNKIQDSIIRINEVERKIDIELRNKFDLLNKSVSIIKGNIEINNSVFNDMIKLRSIKLSNFEFDRKLITIYNEFIKVKSEYKELTKNEDLKKFEDELENTDNKLNIYKEYYDNNIAIYNKEIRVFPSNIIASIYKYKEKTFFDKKDMSDEDENDFKL